MNNRVSTILLAGILVSLIFSCNSDSQTLSGKNTDGSGKEKKLKGTVSISGAFALYPLVNVWAEEFRKEYPDVRFNISGGGAGKGMADVLGGAADLGMFSRDVTDAEREKGAWWISVTKDAVIPTLSEKNPLLGKIKTEGLTREELSGYFLKDGKKVWPNSTTEVNVYTRSDASGAADVWAKYLGGDAQESLKGIAVYGDPGLADAVKNDPKGIGYNNIIYVFDLNSGEKYPGIEVVPIDINENGGIDPEEDFYHNLDEITAAIADGRYPSPPARELYMIAKGKPTDPIILEFLNWILVKGQVFVEANGYILLSETVINEQKKKL
ncbi:MAG: substrate-binding domain-containing protein [Bacteroidia bacterium]|nr:substrate-binding domain-containing protein [Bacteroidia bacterium]